METKSAPPASQKPSCYFMIGRLNTIYFVIMYCPHFVLYFFTIMMVKAESLNETILLYEAIDVLNKALDYMKNIPPGDMILDGVTCTRMVEDQLEMIFESNKRLRDEKFRAFLPQISELQKKAEKIANDFVPFLIKSNPHVTNEEQDWVSNGRWKLDRKDRWVDTKLIYENPFHEDFDEPTSDFCNTEVIGEWGNSLCSCKIGDECWQCMTSFNRTEYWLTHQILYLETAEMCGCNRQMEKRIEKFNQGSLQNLYDVFCSNVFSEAEWLANSGFPERYQDLFAEQVLVCGMASYQDFNRPEWLALIMSWKRPDYYCFGHDHPKLLEKRVEKLLDDNCLIHKTGVCIAAIAVLIRLMITESIEPFFLI